MLIDLGPIFRFPAHFGFARSCKNRLEHFLAKDDQRGQSAQARGWRVVAAGAYFFLDQVFAAEFLEIVGRAPRSLVQLRIPGLYLRGELGDRESVGSTSQGQHGR